MCTETTARGGQVATARSSRALLGARLATGLWTLFILGLLALLVAVWFAGWRVKRVDTGSMSPTLPQNSLAVISPASPLQVHRGDIISFRDPGDRRIVVVHRVVKVIDHEGSARLFKTQGDANVTPDPMLVPASDVEGQLRFHIPRVGKIAWVLRPPLGLIVFAAVPLVPALLRRTLEVRRTSRPDGRVDVSLEASPRKVRAPQGRVVGNTDPG